jgi:hypothetical protein
MLVAGRGRKNEVTSHTAGVIVLSCLSCLSVEALQSEVGSLSKEAKRCWGMH